MSQRTHSAVRKNQRDSVPTEKDQKRAQSKGRDLKKGEELRPTKIKEAITKQPEAISKNLTQEEEKQSKPFEETQFDSKRAQSNQQSLEKAEYQQNQQENLQNSPEDKHHEEIDAATKKDESTQNGYHTEEHVSKNNEHNAGEEQDDQEDQRLTQGFQPRPSQSLIEDEGIKAYMQEFNKYDLNKDGTIPVSDLYNILKNLRKDFGIYDAVLARHLHAKPTIITIADFLSLMGEIDQSSHTEQGHGQEHGMCNLHGNKIVIAPDEKVAEFLKLLNEYIQKCELEGNYSEAKKARAKMEEIKIKETIRQQNQIRFIQEEELLHVENAQKQQFIEFTNAWDNYMADYEATAYMSLEKLKEKHMGEIKEFQDRLRIELVKGYKPSKQLIELRQREQALVKLKKYSEAERIQAQADMLENWEVMNKDKDLDDIIEKKTLGLRKQQQLALNVLLKRIQKDRNQQLKNRQSDSQKLLLKNRNIRSDLIAKHATEAKRALESIKNTLNSITNTKMQGSNDNSRIMQKSFAKNSEGKQDTNKSNDIGHLDVY